MRHPPICLRSLARLQRNYSRRSVTPVVHHPICDELQDSSACFEEGRLEARGGEGAPQHADKARFISGVLDQMIDSLHGRRNAVDRKIRGGCSKRKKWAREKQQEERYESGGSEVENHGRVPIA
eukprot:CAMPEP_0114112946 /NCGR_PEP_ID=MMETSP0043_2-20121206/2652_1 /TAXON_ID=464988 /ORGANISM="Hemiselmis andersenii, Strain CCMP644" /LENGTH=123 /DNA_ID=CAMNT_0001205067 /DNA_START=1490 /DNA_END=1857 /DNA_ORIENTATION=-